MTPQTFCPPLREPAMARKPTPEPDDDFAARCLTRDEQRLLRANLADVFPEGRFTFKWAGNEITAVLTLDGQRHAFRGRSVAQLATYVHDFNLARRTRASEAA